MYYNCNNTTRNIECYINNPLVLDIDWDLQDLLNTIVAKGAIGDQYKTGAPMMMIPKEFDVRKIDVIAFGVVSVLFLIFNVSYWITFLGIDVTFV